MVTALCCSLQRDGTVIFGLLAGLMLHMANLGGGQGLLVYAILILSLLPSGRSPNMTEIMLTGT